MVRFDIAVGLLLAGATCCLAAVTQQQNDGQSLQQSADFDISKAPQMNTNIAVLTSDSDLLNKLNGGKHLIVDPSKFYADGSGSSAPGETLDDIEEDPKDRFITTTSGKIRPILMASAEAGEWAHERPSPKVPRVLSRIKRCGGGDDDGDANRSRRARRTRRTRRRRAQRARRAQTKAAKRSSTTTVTRKVIQNGQVVSQTTQTAGQQPAVAASGQQVVHTVAQPAAVATAPAVTQHVVQQPAAVSVVAAAPAPLAGNPSVSVQGSVKIN